MCLLATNTENEAIHRGYWFYSGSVSSRIYKYLTSQVLNNYWFDLGLAILREMREIISFAPNSDSSMTQVRSITCVSFFSSSLIQYCIKTEV